MLNRNTRAHEILKEIREKDPSAAETIDRAVKGGVLLDGELLGNYLRGNIDPNPLLVKRQKVLFNEIIEYLGG